MNDNESLPEKPGEPALAETKKPKDGGWWETLRTVLLALLAALTIRSLAYEPFHIPSGSMKANLLVGDYLFVSKYTYGYSRYSFPLGLPFFEGRIMENNKPQRGDVVVFRLPKNPYIDYIKRVIGLPGDRIQVKDSVLYINGNPVPREMLSEPFVDAEVANHVRSIPRYRETLPEGKQITILQERTFGMANNTEEYVVPEKHYFMMGDNRDNSRDSRFLDEVGFVPEQNIVGKAQIIFFSSNGKASFWQVWKWPQSMRFDRFLHPIE